MLFFFLGAGSHGLDGEFIYVVDGINVFEKKYYILLEVIQISPNKINLCINNICITSYR